MPVVACYLEIESRYAARTSLAPIKIARGRSTETLSMAFAPAHGKTKVLANEPLEGLLSRSRSGGWILNRFILCRRRFHRHRVSRRPKCAPEYECSKQRDQGSASSGERSLL